MACTIDKTMDRNKKGNEKTIEMGEKSYNPHISIR